MENYIGTDIIEVERIKKSFENEKFAERIFTDNEIKYCENKGEKTKYQSYAARFAAKEAIYKAIAPLITDESELEWKKIEIIKESNGRPKAVIHDENLKKIKIDISLSHIEKYATAVAIVTV